jgi:CDP-paratose 2-epimerase
MKFLVFGGCGFLGSNLASEVLKRGDELAVYDNLSRLGSESNLAWLNLLGQFKMYHKDVRDYSSIVAAINEFKPDVIFHTAGQVAMTKSLENPRNDFEVNATSVFFSSTNKVYGDLENYRYEETTTRYICQEFPNGFPESLPLDFRTPYGCSKGAADQYIKDYSLCYGLKTVVFRHSSIFGGRQFSSVDQGWIGWFVKQAIETKRGNLKEPFSISGNGKQVRDVLFASDIITCYFDALKHIDKTSGQVFNIGGGFENSLSLLELFDLCNKLLDIEMKFQQLPPRQSDQKVFIADINKAERLFSWKPKTDKVTGIKKMIEWVDSL